MTIHRNSLPQIQGGLFLDYAGMETDIIFNKGMELPGFASYPLLETEDGRRMLTEYMKAFIEVGASHNAGVILESPTWLANRDRAAALGYTPERLSVLNKQAIEMMSQVRAEAGDLPTIICGILGPRDDAYAPTEQMTASQAEAYHSEQVAALAQTDADIIGGYTVAYPAEAIGMVLAIKKFDIPAMISFTVETDGRLPTGEPLGAAITEVDAATDSYASYFMINCAHPEHFTDILSDEPWMQRLRGVVANASRCSHAELDEAEELDDGDPEELGQQLAEIQMRFPQISIVGGCCGTDMRHVSQIAKSALANL
ncbi:homocysteine S-methyltransferase family protein [uncultured Aliiroseovarius sp.]|uniref:homocysteine S-methyltransferase family protein n=1 Tax=uncultured Aliiroseovarius sp. TaxID=1658783 RepID=UPI002602BF09|nr:homocysteine S-methyltransferase family protein [uncultured Aliiroseovarius sp.]